MGRDTFLAAGLLLLLGATAAQAGTVSTVAGNGIHGFSGDGGPAVSASLRSPMGVAASSDGTIYFADNLNFRIRSVSGGIINTIAGNGDQGNSGDGGFAIDATLEGVLSIALDDSRRALYISDLGNNRIRKVDLDSGIISAFAGSGAIGNSGDDDIGPNAELAGPEGLAVDALGTVYIADTFNCRIRSVDPDIGIISHYAGDPGCTELFQPTRLAFDSAGNA
ncbi:MAG: hypothetical protein ACRD2A_25060, partial [Vicinamibacterales bacterium]